MSHSDKSLSTEELMRDLNAQLHCARLDIAETFARSQRPYPHDVTSLGHLLGAISTLQEVVSRLSVKVSKS